MVRKATTSQEKEHEKQLIDSPVMVLFYSIDSLEQLYRQAIENLSFNDNQKTTAPDIKFFQGVERCLELKIKLLGSSLRPLPVPASQTVDSDQYITIDIEKLSQQAAKEILELSTKVPVRNSAKTKIIK